MKKRLAAWRSSIKNVSILVFNSVFRYSWLSEKIFSYFDSMLFLSVADFTVVLFCFKVRSSELFLLLNSYESSNFGHPVAHIQF